MTYKKFAYLFLTLIFAICSACSDDNDEDSGFENTPDADTVAIREYRNVIYDATSGNKLDVYLPKRLHKENGAIMLVHGGAWIAGTKDSLEERAKMFTDSGYIAVAINYTLFDFLAVKKAGADSMLNDITRGIAKVKELSDTHNWRIKNLALYGESAGAHLSLLFAYSKRPSALPLKFVADAVGPIDFHLSSWNFGGNYDSTYAILMVNGLTNSKYTLDSFTSAEAENSINSISPLWYVDATSLPTVMAYGAWDKTQNPANGEILSAKLNEFGIKNDLITFEHSIHNLQGDPDKQIEFKDKIMEYAKTYFGY